METSNQAILLKFIFIFLSGDPSIKESLLPQIVGEGDWESSLIKSQNYIFIFLTQS